MVIGVMARAVAGVSIRAAARTDIKADIKATTRNKLIRLIIIWSIS